MNLAAKILTPSIQVLRMHPDAQLPRYAHTGPFGDLAADLHAVSEWKLEPGETVRRADRAGAGAAQRVRRAG